MGADAMEPVPLDPRVTGPEAGSTPALGEVLDDHAELRDLRAQLLEASDAGILSGLAQRLRDLLQAHFAREEADPGLRRLLDQTSGTASARGLVAEHRDLLSALDGLVARIEADSGEPVDALVPEIRDLLERLERHDARETELFGAKIEAGGAGTSPGSGSKALEVNLRRTAVDVVIPAEHAVLLEITASQVGVHEQTRRLLREINHRYVGWAQTLEDLQRRTMGDLAGYLQSERAAEAIGVFLSLYAKVAEQARPADVRETAIRRWLQYMEKVVAESGDARPDLVPVLKRALSRLGAIYQEAPHQAVISSPRLQRLAETLVAGPRDEPSQELLERVLEILASSLRRVFERWIAQPDPADWWREQAAQAPAAALPERVAAISHARLERDLERLDRVTSQRGSLASRAGDLLGLVNNAAIERGYLDASECFESRATTEPWKNRIARIQWLIRVLSSEALAAVHPQAVAEIHHAYRDALDGADRPAVARLLRETFSGLRRSSLSSLPDALHLIAKIGTGVFASGDPELARVVSEEMLDRGIPPPGFSGFTEEWQVRVDPAHIRGIRAFLEVIEANPTLARPLLAGLVVELTLGGVFVADTDLFQKDVSRLLNSGIGPVYHLVKQLLQLFPVYFNEIGAEGEIREVSSRIDEITGRRDPLTHFLRKQSHVESNPRLIGFIDAIGEFWASGDRTPLRPYLPDSLYERLDVEGEPWRELNRTFAALVREHGEGEESGVAGLWALDPAALDRRLARIPGARPVDLDRVRLLARLRRLLRDKYELGGDDLLERLASRPDVEQDEVGRLRLALSERRWDEALEVLLTLLERLKQTITSDERTEGFEDIYRKRHIAVGIPSMYGRYREEKFEALGLSFHVEAFASALFERLVSEADLECVTRPTLRNAAKWLRMLLRALRVDGCRGRGLERGISMLEEALGTEGISADQYVDILRRIERGVEQLVRIRYIDVYREPLERAVKRARQRAGPAGGEAVASQEQILKTSESFLRERIARGFGLQPLDRLVARLLRTLVQARERLDRKTLNLLIGFDTDRCMVPIDGSEGALDGTVALGNKGHLIRCLARDGLPVPPGFILTTELFRCWPAVAACAEVRAELRERIRKEISRLERRTGHRFGSATRPLLLSVRSGAAVSMPGVLDTFLDVGINEEIAEGLAARTGSPWGAWDAHRRFLQFWGMAHGVPRDRFDDLMRRKKAELGVAKKAEIPAQAMRDLAGRYRRLIEDQGVRVTDDPTQQVERCVELVVRSWEAEKARAYRRELQIAEDWGTAVIVQSMVYGNLHDRSGTGVAVTCDSPRSSGDVSIQGDFVVQGQGDDVVSGLVETLPISAEQRHGGSSGERSLERDFPRIHGALLEHARSLILGQGMFHQELEFTFESDDPSDLYILQTRDRVMAAVTSVSAFVPGRTLDAAWLGSGIGAGGGALSGRLAHTAEDVERLRGRFPGDPIILLRPDTVPDDIPLMLRADGVLTTLGGATSHAALVAQQLGRTCVVGCRDLEVDEEHGCSRLGGRTLATGDFLSISGVDGTVYLGRHPVTRVSRRELV